MQELGHEELSKKQQKMNQFKAHERKEKTKKHNEVCVLACVYTVHTDNCEHDTCTVHGLVHCSSSTHYFCLRACTQKKEEGRMYIYMYKSAKCFCLFHAHLDICFK